MIKRSRYVIRLGLVICAAMGAVVVFKLYEHVIYFGPVSALAARLPDELDGYYRINKRYPQDLAQLTINYRDLDGATPYCLKWFEYTSWGQAYELHLRGRELMSCAIRECTGPADG